MATVSFGRVITVKPEYVKNLENSVDNPANLKKLFKGAKKFKMGTKDDMDSFVKRNTK